MAEDLDEPLIAIGLVRSPWADEGDCPPSDVSARAEVATVLLDIVPEYRLGLMGLEIGDRVLVLVWHGAADRDVLVLFPTGSFAPRGVFAGRGTERPNPIGAYLVEIVHLDLELGLLTVQAFACIDGARIIDLQRISTVD